MGFRQMVFANRINTVPPSGTVPLILTVKTDATGGTSANNQFIVPINTSVGISPYDYRIVTNNGHDISNLTGNYTITFSSVGTYEVQIYGKFPSIYFNNGGDDGKVIEVKQWGNQVWETMQSAFYGCINLLNVTAIDLPDFSTCLTLGQMFRSCPSALIINGVENWNVSNITNFDLIFYGPNFNQNITGWNVSNGTSFYGTFLGCTSFVQDISSWDVSKATSLYRMLEGCVSFNINITGWNVGLCKNFGRLFFNCYAFNQPIGVWNMSAATDLSSMFSGARVFNQPIAAWDVSNVTNLAGFLSSTYDFNQPIGNWNTSKVTSLQHFMSYARAFNQDLSAWDVTKVTDYSYFAFGNLSFNNNSLANWNTIGGTTFYRAFESCSVFNGSLSGWTFKAGTRVDLMFRYCDSFKQDISMWNVTPINIFNDFAFGGFTDYPFLTQIYNAWSQQAVGASKTISFGNAKYSISAQSKKDILVNAPNNWTITDGGTLDNTIIGGLASTYPTKAGLATKLGILESDIIYYNIAGSDIEASINVNYSIPAYGFDNNQLITSWLDYGNKCTTINGMGFFNAEQLKRVKFDGVITGNGYSFAETDALKYLELKEMTNISSATGGGAKGSRFIDDSRIEIFIAPKLSSVVRFGFYADGSSKKETKYLYLPAYTNPSNFGDTFFNMNTICRCYFPMALQTSNGGGEDADVAYLRARGCPIIYIQNFTKPSNVTDLSHSAGVLNFTPPASTNAIDKYMVFVNDIYKQIITTSGSSVTGLIAGDRVKIVPFDIYFNRSESNIITI